MFFSKFHYNSAKLLWLEHIQITCDLRPDVWYSGKTSECLLSTTWMICKHIWCQILFLHNFSIRSAVAWILKSFSYFFHSFPPLKGERKTWSWGASKGLFECGSCCAWEMNKLKPCKRLMVTLPSKADRCVRPCFAKIRKVSIPAAREIFWGFLVDYKLLSSLIHLLWGVHQKIHPSWPLSIDSV